MRILIVSDTHGNYPAAVRAATAEAPDLAIHLGDLYDDSLLLETAAGIPVLRVRGNCDGGAPAPTHLIHECLGKRLLLCHGDRYGVKAGLGKLETTAREAGVAAALFGHTHRPLVEIRDGILFVNPGTLAESADLQTYAVLTVTAETMTAELKRLPPV